MAKLTFEYSAKEIEEILLKKLKEEGFVKPDGRILVDFNISSVHSDPFERDTPINKMTSVSVEIV